MLCSVKKQNKHGKDIRVSFLREVKLRVFGEVSSANRTLPKYVRCM
jgi:hypothetical protein